MRRVSEMRTWGSLARSFGVAVLGVGLVAVVPGVAGAQEGPDGGPTPDPTTTAPTTTSTTVPSTPPGDGTQVPPSIVDTTPADDFRDPAAPAPEPPPRESLIPPPIDLTSLNELLGAKRAEAVAAATAAADAANAQALASVAAVRADLDGLTARAPALDSAVRAARAGERRAVAALERARGRKAQLAVESYTVALSGNSPTMAATADLLTDSDGYERYVRTTEYSGAAWRSLERGVSRATTALSQAETTTEGAIEARQRLERRIGAAQAALDSSLGDAQRIAAEGEEAIQVAAATGDDLAVDGLGPTILGETLLTPEDLAGFSARRSAAAPSLDLLELARFFVLEATAEGVRGDIAWAQSILETGNFGYKGSMVSTSDNNYAGIGACDSCSGGFRYDTPQLGARAQMQLLHTYADDNLTAAALAFPPVGKPPEGSSVRGCCDTWMELSGVWATGPGYGVKILTIYNEMLAFAAQRQRDARSMASLVGPTAAAPSPVAPSPVEPAPPVSPG